MTAFAWAEAREVLAVRLDGMGDVLMTAPAIRALREARPGRRITLLTSAAGAAVAPLLPEVDDVIEYAAPWMQPSTGRGDASADRALIERLRAARFDAAAIFTVYSQSPLPAALTCHLAEIPLRLAHARENPYALLTDWVRESEPARRIRHEVRRHLDLVASVGATTRDERLRVALTAADHRAAMEALHAASVDLARPWCAVHPGATAASRRYPPELLAAALTRLQTLGWQCVLLGGSADNATVEAVAAHLTLSPPAVEVPSVPVLAALIAAAPVLLANNSGPAHLAAAVGTPVVVPYALTNPQHTPWGVPARVLVHDVPCRYCYRSVCPEGHNACLRGIDPAEVARSVVEVARAPSRTTAPASAR